MRSTRPVVFSSASQIQHTPPDQPGNSSSFRGWMLLPLRLFAGATFIYAGVQKLMDPQFFQADAVGYIGNQIEGFATGSPLQDLLVQFILPQAIMAGWLVVISEIAIGVCALLGLLFRPAALGGLLISTTFFLTASWTYYPYFLGSDIVFMFCWFTLFLSGPTPTGLPAVDGWLARTLFKHRSLQQSGFQRFLALLLVGPDAQHHHINPQAAQWSARRNFLGGAALTALTALGLGFLVFGHQSLQQAGTTPNPTPSQNPTPTPTTETTATPGSTSTPEVTPTTSNGQAIAQSDAVSTNSAVSFTIAATGSPGVLIRLLDDQFVAYDATCTHRGCEVGYDPGSSTLVCPCHNSQFDPANQAEVLGGPAPAPLAPVAIRVDSATGAITLEP